MQQYTFNIPNNSQAQELLKYILQSKIFHLDAVSDTNISTDEPISTDFWDELPYSLKESILESKEQILAGKTKTNKEMTAKYNLWLTK